MGEHSLRSSGITHIRAAALLVLARAWSHAGTAARDLLDVQPTVEQCREVVDMRALQFEMSDRPPGTRTQICLGPSECAPSFLINAPSTVPTHLRQRLHSPAFRTTPLPGLPHTFAGCSMCRCAHHPANPRNTVHRQVTRTPCASPVHMHD